ncbi:MAG: 3-oxo-tetronate kinase [Burkholderiales bacterium]
MLLGCIADDFTGGTDLASMLATGGMRVVQTIGVPAGKMDDADAVVVALKSRTAPPAQAVAESLAALRWLRGQGCRQFFFKYCSTFDSTPAGNIGPVTDALMAALGATFTIACPAYPENGRTVYRGHLFVGDQLLSESGMKDHPLTPMTDANLVRVLQAQSTRRVALIRHDVVAAGAGALRTACANAAAAGTGIAIVDAIHNEDLLAIGMACEDFPLLTGGSGVAQGLPGNFKRSGLLCAGSTASHFPAIGGSSAIIAGSCSVATNAQVAHWLKTRPGWRLDVPQLLAGRDVVDEALDWARAQKTQQPLLFYATSTPEQLRASSTQGDAIATGQKIEAALADIAAGMAEAGARRFVIAGGETSGAVVKRLGISALRIGPAIDPGVPWTCSTGERPLALVLKSGNFGSADFFEKSLARLQ